VKLELDRYKDLLGLREKEISQLKAREATFRKQEDALKKKIAQLEHEKHEISQLLVK
jgi:phage shock protein A